MNKYNLDYTPEIKHRLDEVLLYMYLQRSFGDQFVTNHIIKNHLETLCLMLGAEWIHIKRFLTLLLDPLNVPRKKEKINTLIEQNYSLNKTIKWLGSRHSIVTTSIKAEFIGNAITTEEEWESIKKLLNYFDSIYNKRTFK